MKAIQELINRIQQARAQSMSLPQEQLRALAEEYCRRCEEAAEQVHYAYSLLQHKKKSAFLTFYREHPHLVRGCELLDMRGRADWVTITQFLGCPPPPELPLKEAEAVRRAYKSRNRVEKNPPRLVTAVKKDPPAAAEIPEEVPPLPPVPPPLPEPVLQVLPALAPLEENAHSLHETDGLPLPSPGDGEPLPKKSLPLREPAVARQSPVEVPSAPAPQEVRPGDVHPATPPLPEVPKVVPPPLPERNPPEVSASPAPPVPPSSPVPPVPAPATVPPAVPAEKHAEQPPEKQPPEKQPPDEESRQFMDIFTPQPPEISPPPVTVRQPLLAQPAPPDFVGFQQPPERKPAKSASVPKELPPKDLPPKELPPKELPPEAPPPEVAEPQREPEKRVRARRRVLLGCVAALCMVAGGGYVYLAPRDFSLSGLMNAVTGQDARPDEKPAEVPEGTDEEAEAPRDEKIRDIFATRRDTRQGVQENGAENGAEKPCELVIPNTEEGRQTRLRYEKAGEIVAQIPAAAEYESAEYPHLAESLQRFFRELWPYRDLVEIQPVSYAKKYRFVYEKTDKRWILRHESDRAVPLRGDYVHWNEAGLQIFRRHADNQALFFTGVHVRTKAGPGLRQREAFFSLFPKIAMIGQKPGAKIELRTSAKNVYDFSCHGLAYALAIRDVPVALRVNYFLEDLPDTTAAVFSGGTSPGGKVPVGMLDIAPTKMTLALKPQSLPELERHYEIRYLLSVSPPELHVEIVPAMSEADFLAQADQACQAEVARLLAALAQSLEGTPAAGNAGKYAQDTRNLLENLATVTEKQVRDTQNRWLQDEIPDEPVKIMEEIVTLFLHRLTVARKTFHFQMEIHALHDSQHEEIPPQLPILDTRAK